MVSTISNIGTEITSIISKTKDLTSKISEQERIDGLLDKINDIKKKLVKNTKNLVILDKLFTDITWLDIKNAEEEKLLFDVIVSSKELHSKAIKNYVFLKSTLWKKNICRAEISEFKSRLDDFEDSFFSVEEIFFTIRKDAEFNKLINSLNF